MTIYAAMAANWPEDEAYALWADLLEGDEPADDDQVNDAIKHMHSVFARENDAAELIARFNQRLTELRAN